jgi:hypothetical protein
MLVYGEQSGIGFPRLLWPDQPTRYYISSQLGFTSDSAQVAPAPTYNAAKAHRGIEVESMQCTRRPCHGQLQAPAFLHPAPSERASRGPQRRLGRDVTAFTGDLTHVAGNFTDWCNSATIACYCEASTNRAPNRVGDFSRFGLCTLLIYSSAESLLSVVSDPQVIFNYIQQHC